MTRVLSCLLLALSLISFTCNAADPARNRLLIRGNIVTPDGVLSGYWIEIQNGIIIHITQQQPTSEGAAILETKDLIFPGFIDLHNHPTFNVLPRWNPPMKFPNRYAWRDWDVYKHDIEVKADQLFSGGESACDIDEYAEIKALIGGTTSMIGFSSINKTNPLNPCIEGYLRILDVATGFYGAGQGHERIVNSVGITPRDMKADTIVRVKDGIKNGTIDLLAIHIAEGLPTDAESSNELNLLDANGLLGPHATLIHSVGLSPAQLARVHAAGSSIVWSPRSNFVLYGATANLDAAFREGVTISLAPDWSPTGSDNMWDEIRYAHKISKDNFSGLFSDRQLVEMASSIPARVARINDKVGTLAPGMMADFFLVNSDDATASKNPYSVIASGTINQVDLVVITGRPLYGDPTLLKKLTKNTEPLTVCGSAKALNLDALPAGSFIAVQSRLSAKLKAIGTDLAPIADCEP
jgi:cytosine/adenosine deaminase-related metal-dependent hydrolase